MAVLLEDSDSWFVREAAVQALRGQSALPSEIVEAIGTRLEDSDGDVRMAAVQALRGQLALPLEVVEAIGAQLEDSSEAVRVAAVQTLRGQSALPSEVIKAIGARIEDSDGYVREVALQALEDQPALPSKVVKAMAARLDDSHWGTRKAAARVIVRQLALSKEVLDRHLNPLYEIWLYRSFAGHLSCWVGEDEMYIDTPEGFRKICFQGQQDQFRNAIRKMHKDFGIPSVTTERTEGTEDEGRNHRLYRLGSRDEEHDKVES
jgi:hypothetical protein